MQTRPFGRTGLVVPVLGFGAMQVGDPAIPEIDAARVLNAALDLGFKLVDTARSYGLSEDRIGRHLAGRRGEFVLSTKVGYGIDGVRDWTRECILAGVDAARERLRTDVIDIVHLHSCRLEILRDRGVAEALADCVERGKVRVAAYSGDGEPLAHAVACGAFGSVQASVSICDQQGLATLAHCRARGLGTIGKRPLAGRPWAAPEVPADAVHAEYHRRFAVIRAGLGVDHDDWDALALRFAACEPGVDCVIVGGSSPAHLARNAAVVQSGPLDADLLADLRGVFARCGSQWRGLV